MKKAHFLLIVAYFYAFLTTQAGPIITFFFRSYPHVSDMKRKIRKPGKIARYMLEGIILPDITNGVFSTYAGFINTSNINGQTIFPRKHTKPFLYIIITNSIIPIPMANNIIHHWELDPDTPARLFTLEQKQDKKTDLFYWNMQQLERPNDNRIPLESLIIIAKPHNVYVPTGITLADNAPNLLLPDIYIKKGINIVKNALFILTVNHLFSPIHHLYKKEAKWYMSHVAP